MIDIKAMVKRANELDERGKIAEADRIDRQLNRIKMLAAAAGSRPTEYNKNAYPRIPNVKDFACYDCGGNADRFFSFGKNHIYSAVCNKCFEEYQKHNKPDYFK